jgi:hypothetical protein
MNKILRSEFSPTLRQKNGEIRQPGRTLRTKLLTFLLIFTGFLASHGLQAQTTTISTETGTNFTGANGVGGDAAITFVVENTNTYAILLTGVDMYWTTTYNGTIPTLWYSATSLSGLPNIAAPTWTSIATGSPVAVTAAGYYPALSNLTFTIPAGTQYRFALQTSLGVNYSGASPVPSPSVLSAGGVNLKVYDAQIAGSNVGYGGNFPGPGNNPRAFTGRIHFQPATPCVAPPTPGQATASAASICPNTNFLLSLTGASGGLGMTFQWQSSANGTTGWTDIAGATSPSVSVSQTATTFYRAQLTCSGQTANSTSVQVTTTATPTSGTFDINKSVPASATSFQSITAAINSIQCGGLNGPITFNVVAGTGPYNEQVIIPVIPGASATNTITFNGNGNTISATPGTTDQGVVTINGGDYVKIDNFIITLDAAAGSGWGIQLKNESNNAIISNNTINLPLTSTSSAINGIIAGSATSSAGNNTSNTLIQNNTINGGYYGIQLNGNTGGTNASNNQIINNQVKDPYFYGIYVTNQTNGLIERNDITRALRTNGSTMYCLYVTGTTTNTVVNKNRIHNLFDAAPSASAFVYGIYNGGSTTVGAENIIKNNLIYSVNTPGGTLYAFYNSAANGTYYYNNTVSADNASISYGTLRGMYFTSASTNVKFINNVISLSSNATTKHAIYLGSSTITLQSNNNDLYVGSSGNVGYSTSAQATLANWQAASSQDANSISVNPMFVNATAGNLQPTSGALNNVGQALAAVTDDITGAPRGTTPDIGAYEFTPAANDVGVIAITAPNSGCGLTSSETITITIQNFGTAAQNNIPVSYTINGGTPVTAVFPGPLAAGQTATYSFTTLANLGTPNTYNIVASTNLAGDALAGNNSFTKAVTAIPTVSTFPYSQNFETGNGGWVASGSNSSWAIGTPAKPVINSAGGGANSYVTGLTGTYNASEVSQVMGPCFNFSSMTSPNIEMKIWWSSEGGWDGAVLQSSINGGTTWQNVGALSDPFNWYNDNSLDGRAGGQDIGWAGTGTSSSSGWVTAKHALTGLGGQSSVLLRIAFGSDASVQYDGFAFDDISIYQTPSNDVELVAITSPATSGCGFTNAETVTVTIKNNGTIATPVPFPVSYQLGAAAPVVENVTTAIPVGLTQTFSFANKVNLATVGTYNLTATTALPGDGLPTNDSKSKTINVLPTISTLPYTQNFENGNGGWLASGTNSSWAIGTPAKAVINSAGGGANSYVTGLTGTYNASEVSQVVGPCFNFSSVADPDFEMKAWWNSEGGWDGAVLQSSIDGGVTWQNVGALNDPNNWYNDNSLDGRAGGQDIGWAGTGSSSSGGWVRVKHKLNGLGGQSSVLLRIAFGADGSVQYDGFAFDDIRIGDNTNNLAVNSFVPLTKVCGFGNNEKVEVVLENLGSVPVTAGSYTVSYTVNNGTGTTPAVTQAGVALAPNVPVNFIFTTGANLTTAGNYTITVTVTMAGDPDASNNTITYTIGNATFTTIPPIFTFETPTTGIAALRTVKGINANITEGAAASQPLATNPATSTKGMIMEGVANAGWTMPAGTVNPWNVNPENFSAAYICFNPSGGAASDPLWLSFDLKQLFKIANANTNFRVTVNGVQVGATYRPPFSGTPINWQKVYVDLSAYKSNPNIQIGLESSVAEAFANGAGTANLIDNIRFQRLNPTGVDADILNSQLNVFPNPSAGVFNVSLPQGKAFAMEVTDLTGRVVMKETSAAKNAQVDLSKAAKGIYLLKVTSEGSAVVRKLIVE